MRWPAAVYREGVRIQLRQETFSPLCLVGRLSKAFERVPVVELVTLSKKVEYPRTKEKNQSRKKLQARSKINGAQEW